MGIRDRHGFAAAVEEALDVEVAAPRLVVEGLEEVAVIEQCEIHAVEGVERAVQVAVIALAGGCDVADDGFVLDAPQRHERHAHRDVYKRQVPRSLAIRMRYMDEDFVEHDEEFHGLKAWVIQHEYDHIEGIVFTDRISPLRRNLLKGKLMNLAKGKYRCAYKTK